MGSQEKTRRLGGLAVALATVVISALIGNVSDQVQPLALPVVFGVALATAISPGFWLVHLVLVGAGLVACDAMPALAAGNDFARAVDLKVIASVMFPALIGAAVVRFACRSAM